MHPRNGMEVGDAQYYPLIDVRGCHYHQVLAYDKWKMQTLGCHTYQTAQRLTLLEYEASVRF